MKYAVYLEPYRLCEGHVGEDIYQPVLISRHRSRFAAARALMRCITGTNPAAKEYLRGVENSGYAIALRYLAWQIEPSGRISAKLSVRELRS